MSELLESIQIRAGQGVITDAIFSVVSDDLAVDRIVPSPLDLRVGEAVAKAVAVATQVADTAG